MRAKTELQAPPREVRELLDRWVQAVEEKNLTGLSQVFRDGDEVLAFWSNGERNTGWPEIREHIEADFRKDVDLRMAVNDVRFVAQGETAGVLSYRYAITLSMQNDSATFHRLASMSVHRDPEGWRVASLHVSSAPHA